MRVVFTLILLFAQFFSLSSRADSFYIDQKGKRYLCDQVDGGGGGSCWSQCPYTFGSCVDSCGGGNECWDRCPYTFGSCADSCGGGSGCWNKCPYTFGSCAEICGGRDVLTPNVLTRILNTQKERAAFEKANPILK